MNSNKDEKIRFEKKNINEIYQILNKIHPKENEAIFIVGFSMDITLCSFSTWIFLRPLWSILKVYEDSNIRRIAKKEAVYVGISLLSTLLTFLGT